MERTWLRMNPLRQTVIGLAVALVVAGVLALRMNVTEMRYTVGFVGALALMAASLLAVLRRLKRGKYLQWLRWHQVMAIAGFLLVLAHGLRCRWVWHSWLAFVAVCASAGIGMSLSWAHRWRGPLARLHFVLMPVVVVSGLVHGYLYGGTGEKVIEVATEGHDQWMLLTKEHDVACLVCHTQPSARFAQYTCCGCHVHDTDQLRNLHERLVVPVSFGRCLDCHGVTYSPLGKTEWLSIGE